MTRPAVIASEQRILARECIRPDRSLQPETLGAGQEATNGLKHPEKRPRRGTADRAGCNRAGLETVNVGADPTHKRGRSQSSVKRARHVAGDPTGVVMAARTGHERCATREVCHRGGEGGTFRSNGEPVRASAGGRRWRMGSYYRRGRVTPVKGRSSDSPQAREAPTARRLTMSLPTSSETVEKLQTSLQAEAKAEPDSRFYALWDKVCRRDVLREAFDRCRANAGAAGADCETFEQIDAGGRGRWLERLREELTTGDRRVSATTSAANWTVSSRRAARCRPADLVLGHPARLSQLAHATACRQMPNDLGAARTRANRQMTVKLQREPPRPQPPSGPSRSRRCAERSGVCARGRGARIAYRAACCPGRGCGSAAANMIGPNGWH